MWAILMATTFSLISNSNTCKTYNAYSNCDTVLLYKKEIVIKASKDPVVLECRFSKNSLTKYNSEFKTILILDNPTVITPPEGIYELYITDQPPQTDKLSSSQPSFIAVLDLYSFTAPGAKHLLEVDISKHLGKYFLQKQSRATIYICLHFDPIKLSDGSYSSNAGEVRFTGIRIKQVKNLLP